MPKNTPEESKGPVNNPKMNNDHFCVIFVSKDANLFQQAVFNYNDETE